MKKRRFYFHHTILFDVKNRVHHDVVYLHEIQIKLTLWK